MRYVGNDDPGTPPLAERGTSWSCRNSYTNAVYGLTSRVRVAVVAFSTGPMLFIVSVTRVQGGRVLNTSTGNNHKMQ